MDTSVLKQLGLDEKEIQVYLCLLKYGAVTASKISRETDIDRTTCYRYLNSLIYKGLSSNIIQNNVKYFKAANPQRILQDIKEKEIEYKKILPELIDLSNSPKEDISAEIYHGGDGLKTILREILRNKEDHLVLGDEGHFKEIFPIFFEQFINECNKNKIKEKILCSESVYRKLKKFDYKYSATKALPNENIFPTTTLITDNKIVLFNWQAPYNAIVIKNKNMADNYRNYFNILWKVAKR